MVNGIGMEMMAGMKSLETYKNFMRNILLLLIFFFTTVLTAEAHRGCCSHHEGVCGCQCCDGTPLSDKCAPYYPEGSSDNKL